MCTTKMRELLADFKEKKIEYIKIIPAWIAKYDVPRALFVGGDETNALFVSIAK